jgi:hypothetical protein
VPGVADVAGEVRKALEDLLARPAWDFTIACHPSAHDMLVALIESAFPYAHVRIVARRQLLAENQVVFLDDDALERPILTDFEFEVGFDAARGPNLAAWPVVAARRPSRIVYLSS